MKDSLLRQTALWVVIAHLLVVGIHSRAHFRLDIGAPGWQGPYVLLVIWIAPVAAAALLRRSETAGYALLTMSMLGSLVFGVIFHYLLPGPDNVAELHEDAWSRVFGLSAAVLAAIEAAGALIGAIGFKRAVTSGGAVG